MSLRCARVLSFAARRPSKRGAVRRGLGADGVEQHAADGGEAPAETLRQKRAAGRAHEGARPGGESGWWSLRSLKCPVLVKEAAEAAVMPQRSLTFPTVKEPDQGLCWFLQDVW